jgi:hypothetical protein
MPQGLNPALWALAPFLLGVVWGEDNPQGLCPKGYALWALAPLYPPLRPTLVTSLG